MVAHQSYRRPVRSAAALALLLGAGACSSSSSSPAAQGGSANDAGPADTNPADSGPAEDASAAPDYAAVVRGKLASSDPAMAKAAHDAIASAGEAGAKAAGNFSHQPHLGTTLLDSTDGGFLSIDRWSDAAAMEAFYADPNVQKAFGGLFAAPPTIEFFAREPSWVSWGDMGSGKASGAWFDHLAIGVLKYADTAQNQKAHDAVAAGGKDPSIAAGNVAHVVYLGLHDRRQFVAFDLWPKSDNIQAFYTNPQFTTAFAALFESVEQPVYQSADWQSW